MVNEKSYKVSIIPALKQSFSLVLKAKRELIILGWLPFLLLTIFVLLDNYFSFLDYIIDYFVPFSLNLSYGVFYDFSYYLIDLILSSAFIIALYRLFIMNEKQQFYVWTFKRGIYEERKILSVPWYFRLGKKELYLIIVYLIVGIVFCAIRQANVAVLIYNLNQMEKFQLGAYDSYIYLALKYCIWLIEGLVLSSLIFVSPAIATAKNFRFSDIRALFLKAKGNIIRIFIIGQLIFLPVFLIGQFYKLIMYFMSHMQGAVLDLTSDVYIIVYNLIFYICIAIDCAFISLIYKALDAENKA